MIMIMNDNGKHFTSRTSITHVPEDQRSIIIKFDQGDPRDPKNFSYARKWAITLTCCMLAGIVGAASSSYSISHESMMQDLDCTDLQANLGLGLYAIAFGVVPLFTSAFSEEFGRRPVYMVSSVLFLLAEVMNALAPNIQTVIASRALQGMFASNGATLTTGTAADIWQPHERGLPTAMLSFSTMFSIGLGSVFGGLIVSNPHLGWRWVQWVHVIFAGAFALCSFFLLSETRSSIVLARIVKDLRKATGDPRYRTDFETDKPNILSMIKMTSTRPLYLLLTEPIVQSFSLWVGLSWGVVYCLLSSVTQEFQSVYNFSVSETGLVFLTQSIGAVIGFTVNMYQDTLYQKNFARKGQEARLYIACIAAIVIPISMFIYTWTASPHIHWIVPLIGLTGFMSGVFVIFQVTSLYVADCYGTYASSAQAGLCLTRNIMALIVPLVTPQMFDRLTYKWALTLWAILAAVLAPVPWVLFFFGPKIRSHSKVSREILKAEMKDSNEDNTATSSLVNEKKV